MKKEKIIEMLREDEHYYGDFGKQYLSNSDIKTLLKNPLALKEPSIIKYAETSYQKKKENMKYPQ
jgi:hypothetical protein